MKNVVKKNNNKFIKNINQIFYGFNITYKNRYYININSFYICNNTFQTNLSNFYIDN